MIWCLCRIHKPYYAGREYVILEIEYGAQFDACMFVFFNFVICIAYFVLNIKKII